MNTRRVAVALLAGLGIAALAWPLLLAPVARIVYNPSDSVPPGWYRIVPPDSLHVGSIVLARLPAARCRSRRRQQWDRSTGCRMTPDWLH